MSTKRSGHQLAAIMFTDIVGYTAMMQQNEPRAIAVINRHQEVLERCVANHDGDVLQYYGDGSLSLFSSALEAVQCAMDIQKELAQETGASPGVPLKIGLHLGEILFQDGKVLGDGVNVASRIESLGQAGTILFSKSIWEQIRNRPDFQAVSLGRFNFKNVQEPLEVYALSNAGFPVPEKDNLEGKIRISKTGMTKWILGLSTALLLLIAGSLIFTNVLSFFDKKPTDIHDKRVAVMIFDNQTGDETLSPFGLMASDFITTGFIEAGRTQVVIPQNIQDNIQLAAAGNTVSPAFVKATGADLVIEGRYYLQDGELFVHARAINVGRKNEIETVWTAEGPREELTDILYGLTQQILGYWALKGKQSLGDKPPRYDAYQEWMKGEEYFGWNYQKSAYHLQRAYELDSSFYVPLLKMIPLYLNQENYDSAVAVIRYIRDKDPRLGQWERWRLESFEEVMKGNWAEVAAIYEKMMAIAPGDNISIYMAAFYHLSSNAPSRTIEILKHYQAPPLEEVKIDFEPSLLAEAHFWLGHYQEVCQVAESYDREIFPTKLAMLHLAALVHLNDFAQFDHYLARYQHRKLDNDRVPDHMLSLALVQMKKLDRQDLLHLYGRPLTEKTPADPDGYALQGLVHYLFGEYPLAAEGFRTALDSIPDDPGLLGALGSTYALTGNTAGARTQFERIFSMKKPYTRGQEYLHAAKIEAHLGNRAKAVELLQEALRHGLTYNMLQEDPLLLPLDGYPPFEELITSRKSGPS